MIQLRNPFDDPVFTAFADELAITRDDVPTEYDPGLSWGNDYPNVELAGMPEFEFLVGDKPDEGMPYPGLLTIDIDHDTRYTRSGRAWIDVDGAFPETVRAASIGRPLGSVIEIPGHEKLIISAFEPDVDDATRSVISVDDTGTLEEIDS